MSSIFFCKYFIKSYKNFRFSSVHKLCNYRGGPIAVFSVGTSRRRYFTSMYQHARRSYDCVTMMLRQCTTMVRQWYDGVTTVLRRCTTGYFSKSPPNWPQDLETWRLGQFYYHAPRCYTGFCCITISK